MTFGQAPDTAWIRAYDRAGANHARWITETADHGFALVGISQISGNAWCDIFVVRTDVDGEEIWRHTYGDSIIGQEASCVKEDWDGGFVWCKNFSRSNGDYGWSVDQTSDGGYVLAGESLESGPTYYDFFVVKLNSTQSAIDNEVTLPSSFTLQQNYSNPFNASTEIRYSLKGPLEVKIDIYDAQGRLVESLYNGVQQPGDHYITRDASDYSSGTYYAKITGAGWDKSIKMVLLK